MPKIRVLARSAVLLGSMVVLFSGCLDADRVGFRVVNDMSVPVRVLYVHGTQETEILSSLLPGESGPVNRFVARDECLPDSLKAVDGAGVVVATFAGPVCDRTEWHVRGSPAPSG
jgi:hypothetical protein